MSWDQLFGVGTVGEGSRPKNVQVLPDHRALEATWGRDKAGPGAHSLQVQGIPLKVRKISNLFGVSLLDSY